MIAQIRQKDNPLASLVSAPVAEVESSALLSAPAVRAAKPRIHAEVGRYTLRLAQSPAEVEEACRLRFRVFNIELGEGLESAYQTGIDTDEFDRICEHLLVEDKSEGRVVGTYRMQTGETAARNLGYYSEREFSFKPYEPLRRDILELGRASIDRNHRTPEVLTLLWRGICQYANDMGLRYLMGCSSVNTKDPAVGWEVYRQLERFKIASEFETEPTVEYTCPDEARYAKLDSEVTIPKLLKTYLAIGAWIGGAPAWDREFGTIDFLTFMDLTTITASAKKRFLAPLHS